VYEQIGSEPVHPEFLGRQCGIPLSGLFGLLWELECRGLIRPCTPGTYIRVPRTAAGRDAKEK
jgi:predicted Rossmann fold nucleotide-binding protein DprA/Smf involved in DNA uptake